MDRLVYYFSLWSLFALYAVQVSQMFAGWSVIIVCEFTIRFLYVIKVLVILNKEKFNPPYLNSCYSRKFMDRRTTHVNQHSHLAQCSLRESTGNESKSAEIFVHSTIYTNILVETASSYSLKELLRGIYQLLQTYEVTQNNHTIDLIASFSWRLSIDILNLIAYIFL